MIVITEVISMFQELDLLEAHLEESQHWADRIVIIESPVTFTTQPKEMHFLDNKERFKRFNVDYLVTPPDEFIKIPFSYPKEETTEWFRARRTNRNWNRQYHWDEVRRGTDYVYFNDVDEFISRDCGDCLKDVLKSKEAHYGSIRTRKFNFFINARGSKQDQYRITRSDLKSFEYYKGFPKVGLKHQMGWHFTTCFFPEDIYLKYLGISCHLGLAPADIPSVELIKERLDNCIEPYANIPLIGGIKEIMPRDDLSWAPQFIQDNPDKFPWLDPSTVTMVNKPEGSWRIKH